MAVDQPRIAAAVREILLAIGEDPDRDGLRDTPSRVARMYDEICAGLFEDPSAHLKTTFEADHDEMVLEKDIPLFSICEHHLVAFHGRAHVAYIPNDDGRVTGLSKLARLVDSYSRRPQVQERLTSQIADELDRTLQPKGVMVVVEAGAPEIFGLTIADMPLFLAELEVVRPDGTPFSAEPVPGMPSDPFDVWEDSSFV